MRIPFFQQRKDISTSKSTKPKSAHETARDIRLQKIKEYEMKLAAKKAADADNQLKNSDLALSVLPNTTTNKDANNNNIPLADDATDTNSPGNSDNDDPTVNDDDDEDVDNTTNTNPHIDTSTQNYHGIPSQLSPISVLSAEIKPTLIHPPRSITRDSNGQAIVENSNDDNNNTSSSNSNTNAISMLCGCI